MKLDSDLKTLLVDADDTLWENNIYFEQVIESFLGMMEDLNYKPSIVRKILNEIERKNIQLNGYGVYNFVQSLRETLSRLRGESSDFEFYLGRIDKMAEAIFSHPMELLAGVEEGLEYLSRSHRTILFTKGSLEEQKRKIEASGLARFFWAIEIVREKDPQAFRDLLWRHQLSRESTWMIGNSPKSDINPAVAAGINAIYIPHARTWELEKEALSDPEKVTILNSFGALIEHFR